MSNGQSDIDDDTDDAPPAEGLNLRRIAIAGSVIGALVLGVGGFFGVQAYRTSQRLAEKKQLGLHYVQRNATTQQQAEAVGLLGAVIHNNPDDVEALTAYATACLRTPKPDSAHLLAAASAWTQVVVRAPNNDDIRRRLVLLYDQIGESSRVVDLVGPLRRNRPDDVAIARAHATALLRLGRSVEALDAVTAWTRLEPESLAAQTARVSAMRGNNVADRDVDAYIESQLKAHPDSPSLNLLKAQWLLQTARAELAQPIFEKVLAEADRVDPASELAGQMVVMLDNSGKRRQATQLLQNYLVRAAGDPKSLRSASVRSLYTLLALRAWDTGDHPTVARCFTASAPFEVAVPSTQPAASQPASRTTVTLAPYPVSEGIESSESAIEQPEVYAALSESARWYAYAALHASLLNDQDALDAALQQLDRLPSEFAEAWQAAVGVLRGTETGTGDTDEQRFRSLYRKFDRILRRGARDPLLYSALAEMHMRITRPDDADRILADASFAPAGWSIATSRLVQLRRSRGQTTLALEVAKRGLARSESSAEHAVRFVQVLHDINARSDEQQRQLNDIVRLIHRAQPLEANTLAIFVELLAKQGDTDEARRQIEAALASDRIGPRTLVELATVSFANKLGLEARCHERAQQLKGGDSPEVLLNWARLEHAAGRTDAAIARLDERVAQASTPEQKRSWQEVRAAFLVQIGAADAAKAWIELADAYPDDLPLQKRLLALQGAVDAAAQQRAIERLKKTSPDDPAWRIAAARIALSAAPPPDAAALKQLAADLSAIVERKPEQLDARMLLVECLRRLGNNLAAVQQLERADEATPGQPAVLLLTAQLVFEQGDRDRASEVLARFAALNAPLTPAQRFVAGQLYARLDRVDAAIEQLQAGRGASREGDRLLVQLLYRVGRSDEANKLLDELLIDPDAETLLLGAGLAESRGDSARAGTLLERLSALPAPQAHKLLLLARYHLNWGRRDLAESLLIRAVSGGTSTASSQFTIDPAAPVEAHLLLAQLRIEQGRTDDAVAVLRASAQALPHEVSLTSAASQADRILVAARAGGTPLAVALMSDPTNPGLQALADFLAKPLADSSASSVRAEQAELDRLAESYAEVYVVQLYCADQFLQRNQPLRAASIASRLVARNPSDPAPARLAAIALTRAGEWRQCAAIIDSWRAKLPPGSSEPDALEANSFARLGRHEEVLTKYLARAKASPKSQPADLLAGVALSLHATRRDAEANELVWSAISDDPRKISLWLDFAAQHVDPPSSAAAWCDRVESGLSSQSTSATLRTAIVDARDRIADRAEKSDPSLAARLHDLAEREARRVEAMPDAPAPALIELTQRRARRAARLTAQPELAKAEVAIAETVYRAWMSRAPDDWVVKNNFANLLIDQSRFDEAASLIDAALKLAPTEAALIDTHATLLLRKGDAPSARAEAKRAVDLQPLNPLWRLTLAEATWATNDKAAAQAELAALKWHYREREFWPQDQVERYVKLDRAINPPPAPTSRPAGTRPAKAPDTP